jgi:quercetin dioxygenase-like cupin family protein
LLWIACGTDDRLIDINRKFRKWLASKAYKHVDIETPGAHMWMVWRRNLTEVSSLLFVEADMKKMNGISGRTAKSLLGVVALMVLLVAVAASSRGQEQISKRGIVTPLASANLVFDGEPACLKVARENGDPDKGASTFLLEAPSGCVVPAHYHTAEEQLMVVQGDVLTGMDGMAEVTLGRGGFAMMPSKAMHWFTCKSKNTCLMFVTFDRTYDIVWAKQAK